MTRLSYPEPDRWYLPVMESVKYHIDSIEHGLRLRTDDPVPSFRAIVRHSEYLHKLIRFAAIQEERKSIK